MAENSNAGVPPPPTTSEITNPQGAPGGASLTFDASPKSTGGPQTPPTNGGGAKDQKIVFDVQPSPNTIPLTKPEATFSWHLVDPAATAQAIVLYAVSPAGDKTPKNLARIDLKDGAGQPVAPFISASNTSAVLNVTAFSKASPFDNDRTHAMRLAVHWWLDPKMDLGGSETFAIYDANANTRLGETEVSSAAENAKADNQFELPHSAAVLGSGPVPSPKASSSNSPSSGGSEGLSTGAMVGIGVGCGLGGILLISLILWLIFRRHRDNKRRSTMLEEERREQKQNALAEHDSHSPTASATSPTFYPRDGSRAEKDLPVVKATETLAGPPGLALTTTHDSAAPVPRASQLIEAHNEQRSAPAPAPAAAPVAVSGPPSAPPSAPAPSPPTAAHVAQMQKEQPPMEQPLPPAPIALSDASRSTSSLSRQVPQSVAHLVEDGMTDEDILRLEEEERLLDLAIERGMHKSK